MLWSESFNFQAICRALFDALGFGFRPSTIPQITFIINNICNLMDQILY